MNDIIIKVDTETGKAVSNTELLGIKGQNLQNKLIFKMSEKIKGVAWCEVRQGNTLSYIPLKENNTGYEADILSSLLTTPSIDVNLRITEVENSTGIPVFVSSVVSFIVLDTINASEQMPEEYPTWLDIANAKIQEIENVNIESKRIDTGVLIKTTNNQGQTTTVELKDGKDGEKGDKGDQGEPGAIKMQIVDVLPTTGRSDTIYLVKKEVPSTDNSYDEYIYTGTAWEHIGDTSIDLSDYYTKEETDEALSGKQDPLVAGDNIKLENNTISAEMPIYVVDYTKLNEVGSTLKRVLELQKNGISFQLSLKRGNAYYSLSQIADLSSSGSVLFYFYDPELSGQLTKYGVDYETTSYYYLYFSLTDETVRPSRPSTYSLQRGNSSNWPLGAKNTEEYTPTSNYNPATKKYVDDSIKASITDVLGGSY